MCDKGQSEERDSRAKCVMVMMGLAKRQAGNVLLSSAKLLSKGDESQDGCLIFKWHGKCVTKAEARSMMVGRSM